MGRATLILDADVSALRRAMGEIPGITQRAQAVMTSQARRGGRERVSVDQSFTREHEAISMRLRRAREKQEKDATAKAKEEERKRARDAGEFARVKDSIHAQLMREKDRREKAATRAEEIEGRKRVAADVAFSKEKDRAHAAMVRARQRREQQATRERRAAEREGGRVVGRIGSAIGGAATGFATGMDGQIQSARQRRAAPERAVGNAIYQAGGDRSETAAAMRRIAEFAQANRIPAEEVAQALQGAQTEQSVLGSRGQGNAQTRNDALTSFLNTALLARNTGNDVGETTRLAGLFASQGFDPALQRQMLLYTAGATQRGAVEIGDVTRGAMPAITARMGAAMSSARLAPGSSTASVQAAGLAEYRQALAEIEVAKGTQGASPREAGNAMRNVSTALQSSVTQEKLLNNIRNSLGANSALEQRLYEADPAHRGQSRLRAPMTNALSLVGAFEQLGMTSTQFQNITGGGGAGNPLSMLANQRRLLGGLLDTDAGGTSGAARVRELMNPNVGLTEADVARGAGIFANDTMAQLVGNEEANTNALRDLHPDLVSVSDSINNWKMRNPWLATGTQAGGSAVSDIAKTLGTAATGGGSVAAVLRPGAMAGARALLARGGAALGAMGSGALRAAAGVPMLLGSLLTLGGSYGGVEQDEAQAQRRGGVEYERQSRILGERAQAEHRPPPTAAEIGAAVALALRGAPLAVAPDQHANAHAASAAAPQARR